ncbi:MAG: ATP-binding cassette domain-containing protein [Proteobacteria bacterium]|jgi:iron complex transport system ATP-binding protein|nr:ATP-binding cassette domain-containing protein [Pseudomonadota bacterium]
MNNKKPWLQIENATIYRENYKVFDRLCLSVEPGQHTAILGPNGAGKSTLLKLVTRELYPVVADDAWVSIMGSTRPLLSDIRTKIGMVSQDLQNNYFNHVTGLDIVISGLHGSVGLWKHQEITREQTIAAAQILAELGIEHLADKRYREMSTGQQRFCLLGRAIVHMPDHYILDEPTSGLDLRATFEYLDRIRKLAQQGKTLLLVTHHIHEIPPEVERVVFLKNGRLTEDGEKPALLTNNALSDLFDTPIELEQRNGFYQAFPKH